MATMSGVSKALESAGERQPKEGPGVLGALFRGVLRSPGGVSDMSDMMRRRPSDSGEMMRQGADRRSGIPEPVTHAEKIFQRVGETAPFLAATAPGTAVGGPLAVLGALGLDISASIASEGVAEMGGGPVAQTLAGAATAMAAPAVGIPKIARRAGTQIAKQAAGDATEAAAKIATKYGVKPGIVQEAASELKRRIARDPMGKEKFIGDAVERVQRGRDLFPDPKIAPTSRQHMGREAGQNISSMEESLARGDLDFSASIDGRRRTVRDALEIEFDDIFPEGSLGGARDALTAEEAIRHQAATKAFDDLDLDSMAPVSTQRIKAAAQKIVDEAGLPDDVPSDVKAILGWGDEVSARRFQNTRKSLLRRQRIGSRATADSASAAAADVRRPVMDAFEAELDVISKANPDSGYREALTGWRTFKQEFDPNSAGISALADYTEVSRVVSKIKGAADPEGEARRAVAILSKQEGGLDSFRYVFLDDLLGETLDEKTPRQIQAAIRKRRGVYREVLGDELLERVQRLIEKDEMSRVGKAGTAAATASTGTGGGALSMLYAGVQAFTHPVESAGKAFGAVSEAMRRDVRNAPERAAVLREALLDRDLFEALLRMPDERSLPAWMVSWKQVVARAEARRSAMRVASREAVDSDIGDQPKGVR